MANWFESAFDGDWDAIGSDIGSFFSNVTGQRESFDYQKELNDVTMSREDNAFQRAVADARKAGLSPLAVTSGASANSMSSARLDNSGAFSFGTSLIDSISSARLKGAQADAIRKETAWNESHGYRNQDFQTALVGVIGQLIDKIGQSTPSAIVSSAKDTAKEVIDAVVDAVPDKVKDTVSNVGNAVANGVTSAKGKVDSIVENNKPISDFNPLGFALSSKATWTLGELQRLHDVYGVGLRFPDKKEYVDIARKYGVTSANSWLRAHTYTADGYLFGRPKQLKYRNGGRIW